MVLDSNIDKVGAVESSRMRASNGSPEYFNHSRRKVLNIVPIQQFDSISRSCISIVNILIPVAAHTFVHYRG